MVCIFKDGYKLIWDNRKVKMKILVTGTAGFMNVKLLMGLFPIPDPAYVICGISFKWLRNLEIKNY